MVRTANQFDQEFDHGESHLVDKMRLFDEETHFNYFRMSRRKFDGLPHLIGGEITRGNNHTLPMIL